MIQAIQRAYYLRAMNPSDDATLIQLAGELGLDVERFTDDLNSEQTRQRLQQQMQQAHSLPIEGFPSLVLHSSSGVRPIQLDYNSADNMLRQIKQELSL